ncbi:MAG: hypothetical protein JNK23_24385 [Opitutaceae bacterium]|nr:hypothetical protein [Opitutaceae bacterium]
MTLNPVSSLLPVRGLLVLGALGLSSLSGIAATLTITSTPYSNGNGLGGGEFSVVSATLSNTGYSPLVTTGFAAGALQTFCLEFSEHISSGSNYNYTIGNAATLGSGGAVNGSDLISAGTAWLYAQFATGTLAGYNYALGAGRTSSNNALQLAFWFLEDETQLIPGYGAYNPNTNPFLVSAISHFGTIAGAKADATNSYGTAVLNLTAGQTHKQSQLFYVGPPSTGSVPDAGASVWLLAGTLVAAIGLRRRFASRV